MKNGYILFQVHDHVNNRRKNIFYIKLKNHSLYFLLTSWSLYISSIHRDSTLKVQRCGSTVCKRKILIIMDASISIFFCTYKMLCPTSVTDWRINARPKPLMVEAWSLEGFLWSHLFQIFHKHFWTKLMQVVFRILLYQRGS